MGDLHVVALSGGADSSAMALRLHEMHPDIPYAYVCTPTGDELPDMFSHWRRLSDLLGSPIQPIMHNRMLRGLIDDQQALPNHRQRWCTRMLKIEPYAAWLMRQSDTHDRIVSYVGLRADEPLREGGDYSDVPGVERAFPLRDWGWGRGDVLAYLRERGVTIPRRTDCARCFWQSLPEWHDLWRDHADIWADAVAQEDATGHTFRSPGRDTWPVGLRELGERFGRGYVPREQHDLFEALGLRCRVCRI
jgi:hypothetical protein